MPKYIVTLSYSEEIEADCPELARDQLWTDMFGSDGNGEYLNNIEVEEIKDGEGNE